MRIMVSSERRSCVASSQRSFQKLDGHANTQPSADGILPELMHMAGFRGVKETLVIPTLNGSISLYRGIREA